MTPKLWGAKKNGREVFVYPQLGDRYGDLFTSDWYYRHELTDLTELVTYPKESGVWVEDVTAEELAHFVKFATYDNGMFNYEDHGKFYLTKTKLAQLSATPEAQEASAPGVNEAAFKKIVSFGDGLNEQKAVSGVATNIAKVTIELTEDDCNWLKTIAKFCYEQERPGWGNFIKEFIGELTPPMSEPKEFGAIVEASHQLNPSKRQKWVSSPTYQGDLCWHSEDCAMQPWIHLISPTRIEGGEK